MDEWMSEFDDAFHAHWDDVFRFFLRQTSERMPDSLAKSGIEAARAYLEGSEGMVSRDRFVEFVLFFGRSGRILDAIVGSGCVWSHECCIGYCTDHGVRQLFEGGEDMVVFVRVGGPLCVCVFSDEEVREIEGVGRGEEWGKVLDRFVGGMRSRMLSGNLVRYGFCGDESFDDAARRLSCMPCGSFCFRCSSRQKGKLVLVRSRRNGKVAQTALEIQADKVIVPGSSGVVASEFPSIEAFIRANPETLCFVVNRLGASPRPVDTLLSEKDARSSSSHEDPISHALSFSSHQAKLRLSSIVLHSALEQIQTDLQNSKSEESEGTILREDNDTAKKVRKLLPRITASIQQYIYDELTLALQPQAPLPLPPTDAYAPPPPLTETSGVSTYAPPPNPYDLRHYQPALDTKPEEDDDEEEY